MEPKNQFWGIFSELLRPRPATPYGHAQIFCQMKGLIKIHNRAKFHRYSVCGSQVTNFQKFSWRWSIHELGHFGCGFGP